MKIYKLIFTSLFALALMASCEKYEDYVVDFDYTATYFGTQKPLRTIVAYDDMEFEVGVTLAGMREDNGSHTVNFKVDTNLLNVIPEATKFTLLPESYYTLGHESSFNIVKDHMRVVKVSLNKDAFTSDLDAINNTYALPLRITSSSVDSIPGSELDTATISSKDITILVIKYISQYSGYYYSKGTQYTLDANGDPADTTVFYDNDLSQNMVKQFTTDSVNVVSSSTVGADISANMQFTIENDNSVKVASSNATIDQYNCKYSAENRTFYLDMNLTKSGTSYRVMDTLILRQAPELDLRFEVW